VQRVDVIDQETDVIDTRWVAGQARVTADCPFVPGLGRKQEQLGMTERHGYAPVALEQHLETEVLVELDGPGQVGDADAEALPGSLPRHRVGSEDLVERGIDSGKPVAAGVHGTQQRGGRHE
jgi:hypothetical protein